jgi:hypothetical protein
MAATEVKVPTTAAYADATLSVVQGETVAIFTDDAEGLRGNESVTFYLDTPDNDLPVFTLSGKKPAEVMGGTMDLIGKKLVTAVAVGVAKYTPA